MSIKDDLLQVWKTSNALYDERQKAINAASKPFEARISEVEAREQELLATCSRVVQPLAITAAKHRGYALPKIMNVVPTAAGVRVVMSYAVRFDSHSGAHDREVSSDIFFPWEMLEET